jgi:hypothetical protein
MDNMATPTTSSSPTGSIPPRQPAQERHDSPLFAAVVLGVTGIMRIFDAIWAFRYHGTLPNNLENAIFGHSLKTYGWVYLVVAAVLIVTAVFLMRGAAWARWAGMIAAGIAIVSAAWWLPYYPVWSLVYIALGAFVIYTLATQNTSREASRAGSW